MDIDYSKYSNFQLIDVFYRIDKKRNLDDYSKLESQIRHNLNIEVSKKLTDPDIKILFDQILYNEDPKNYNKYLTSSVFLSVNKIISAFEILGLIMFFLYFFNGSISLEIPILTIALTGYYKFGSSFITKVILIKKEKIIEPREPNKFFIAQIIIFIYSSVLILLYIALKMNIIEAT